MCTQNQFLLDLANVDHCGDLDLDLEPHYDPHPQETFDDDGEKDGDG